MAVFTGIASASERLQKMMQEALVPNLVASAGRIALCSPSDEEDIALGIFLYDIQEYVHMRSHTMIDLPDGSQMKPPMYLTLYYMITAYAAGDLRFRRTQEERILGRVIQYFYDHPVFELGGEKIQVQMEPISTEDKLKLWSFPNVSYKTSVYYKISPVPVESEVVNAVDKVTEVEMRVRGWKKN